jgi:hypothetical protein
MSVRVDLDKLAAALADFTFAYLITVGEDLHAHTVAVQPTEDGLTVAPTRAVLHRKNNDCVTLDQH